MTWEWRFEKSSSVTCVIDAEDTIIYCNPAWDTFALQNNGAGATASHVLGRSLLAYIPLVLKSHYRKLIAAASQQKRVLGSNYECHRADLFRQYYLKLLPIPDTSLLAMVHSLYFERAMTLAAVHPSACKHGPDDVVTMCAQCRCTRMSGTCHWIWVPDFVQSPPRRISHGICPDCTMYLYA